MNNYETLWQPGTDHAGIATQALVEKKLEKEGHSKHDLGREKFINQVWEWKNQYGDIIINQLKKLGCSCDWSRNAFTMDENLSKSVIKVFVDLYKKGLIYKSKKLVNWDTVLKTAISDLEVDQREVNSKLYYICLLYTSDAADDLTRVDLGGRRIIKKKNDETNNLQTERFFFSSRRRHTRFALVSWARRCV